MNNEEMAEELAGFNMVHTRIHSRADELIACLEGEIAKRDEELADARKCAEIMQQAAFAYQAELSAIKAQEPVGYADITSRSFAKYKSAMHCLPLYAAPVSEAKAQGVVMPVRRGDALDAAELMFNRGHDHALDEVARLNAAPASPAANAGVKS